MMEKGNKNDRRAPLRQASPEKRQAAARNYGYEQKDYQRSEEADNKIEDVNAECVRHNVPALCKVAASQVR